MQYKKKIIGYSRYSMASLVSDLIKKASTLVGVNNDGDDGNGSCCVSHGGEKEVMMMMLYIIIPCTR